MMGRVGGVGIPRFLIAVAITAPLVLRVFLRRVSTGTG
jgi:hypothetical protein